MSVDVPALFRIADRLDQIACQPRIKPADIRACLTELESAWTGGLAAPAAHAQLRKLLYEIVEFDPSGDGRLVVVFGDPVHARNIATYVPGAGSSLADVDGDIDRARVLWERASTLDPSTAVVMWLGYDAPDFADAGLMTSAAAAAPALRDFQGWLVSSHDGPIGQMTVLGHSYGAVVIGAASPVADDYVVLGAPGMGVSHASGLSAPVWAATAANDPVRWVPDFLLGQDPADPAFGARIIDSARRGHSGYFEADNPALQTMAEIVTGYR